MFLTLRYKWTGVATLENFYYVKWFALCYDTNIKQQYMSIPIPYQIMHNITVN